jgi:hypothetical protein
MAPVWFLLKELAWLIINIEVRNMNIELRNVCRGLMNQTPTSVYNVGLINQAPTDESCPYYWPQ